MNQAESTHAAMTQAESTHAAMTQTEMTQVEQRLRELGDLPVELPGELAQRSWSIGRRQRRRNIRLAVCGVALVAGVGVGVVAAHPALAVEQGPGQPTAVAVAHDIAFAPR